jgi:hypothetical protein
MQRNRPKNQPRPIREHNKSATVHGVGRSTRAAPAHGATRLRVACRNRHLATVPYPAWGLSPRTDDQLIKCAAAFYESRRTAMNDATKPAFAWPSECGTIRITDPTIAGLWSTPFGQLGIR